MIGGTGHKKVVGHNAKGKFGKSCSGGQWSAELVKEAHKADSGPAPIRGGLRRKNGSTAI